MARYDSHTSFPRCKQRTIRNKLKWKAILYQDIMHQKALAGRAAALAIEKSG
jgi:hypothetical protein